MTTERIWFSPFYLSHPALLKNFKLQNTTFISLFVADTPTCTYDDDGLFRQILEDKQD